MEMSGFLEKSSYIHCTELQNECSELILARVWELLLSRFHYIATVNFVDKNMIHIAYKAMAPILNAWNHYMRRQVILYSLFLAGGRKSPVNGEVKQIQGLDR